MEIEFLGTGTSTGIPQIGCACATCKSENLKDKRLRTSAIIRTEGKNILIDCGPDFRTQILRASSQQLDALLLTHSHYDHVGGIDDLRPYCAIQPFPIYAQQNVISDIKARLPYCFSKHPYPGVPQLDMIPIDSSTPFCFANIKIFPLAIWHYKLLINGYRIGDIAYITDAKTIDDKVIESLTGIKVLVINALRITPHLSHLSLEESLSIIARIAPQEAYLIHMSHDMGKHDFMSLKLPANVHFAYDGLILHI